MVGATLPKCIREVFEKVVGLGSFIKVFLEGRQIIHQSLFCLCGENKEALLSRVADVSIRPIHSIYITLNDT